MIETRLSELYVQKPQPNDIQKIRFTFKEGKIVEITAYFMGTKKRNDRTCGLQATILSEHHDELIKLIQQHHADPNVTPTPETFHGTAKLKRSIVGPLKKFLKQLKINPKPLAG